MQQNGSHFLFSRPNIYFGIDNPISDLECEMDGETEDLCLPFVLTLDPKHLLSQKIGVYLQWF